MEKNSSSSILIIEAEQINKQYFKDIIHFKELFYFLAWRDIVVRYKQTGLGILWALIRPLLNMAVFVFVFGRIAHLPSDDVSYPLFVLAAMLPWQLFAGCIIDTSQCLINNAAMISKIYFPRIILPISHIIVHFVDFLISMAFLLLVFLISGYLDQWRLIFIPVFTALTLVFCLGASLWLAAATVRYRDFRFILPFLVQFGIFVSPVGYSSFLISEPWRWLYFLNPMAAIIEGFRWSCFGVYHADLLPALILSCCINLILLVTGFRFFRKMERVFADII